MNRLCGNGHGVKPFSGGAILSLMGPAVSTLFIPLGPAEGERNGFIFY